MKGAHSRFTRSGVAGRSVEALARYKSAAQVIVYVGPGSTAWLSKGYRRDPLGGAMRLCCLCTLMRDPGKTFRTRFEDATWWKAPGEIFETRTRNFIERIPMSRRRAISILCVHKCPWLPPSRLAVLPSHRKKHCVNKTGDSWRQLRKIRVRISYPRLLSVVFFSLKPAATTIDGDGDAPRASEMVPKYYPPSLDIGAWVHKLETLGELPRKKFDNL